MGAGSLPSACLNDAVEFAGGFDHDNTLTIGNASGIFNVDVLAGFARVNRNIGVPMVGSRDAHGVDGGIGEDLTEVPTSFGW